MAPKYLTQEEKARILALREENVKITEISHRVRRCVRTILKVISDAKGFPPGYIPPRKPITGRKPKTSKQTDAILKREVLKCPSITSTELKKLHPELLKDVALRTIRHRLLKDLNLPSRRAAKKPLLTEKMKLKRLNFARSYKHWTKEQWSAVMFSDESSFKCIRTTSNRVRRPHGSNRYDPKYTMKTVKHPDSVMVWGAFSGNRGRAGLYFIPKKQTMNSDRYIEVLEDHLLNFYELHSCDSFMQDGAPCHTSKKSTKWLVDNNIEVLEWPGNSPDLNPIENAWNYIKNKLEKENTISYLRLVDAIKKIWIRLDPDYFKKLSDSMPERMRLVIEHKGEMTKY
jgi:hypothetical protein